MRRNPVAARNLMKFCGYQVDGSDEDYRDVARKGLHFVALEPRPDGEPEPWLANGTPLP